MEHKRKSLLPFVALGMLLLCGMTVANAQTSQEIAKKALNATVLLVMKDANGRTLGLGSGFFVQPNQIATNFHVIEGATSGTAKSVGRKTEYNIEGFTAVDEKHDLAILQVSVSSVQPLPLGDSDKVEIGEKVYVAGNPKGLEGTFSDGIISSFRGNSTDKRIQMTAPISPGSSGGPVLNEKGEVIGVSVATYRGGQNLNFAVPSNNLKALIAQLGSAKPLPEGKQSISAETYFRWGNAMYNLGLYQDAIANYDAAIRLKTDYVEAYNNRGKAKHNLKQYLPAIKDYDTAIELKLDYAEAYNNRGKAKHNLKQYLPGIKDYDTAIELKPDYVFAYNNRGHAKYFLKQHFAAISDFEKAIELKPDYAEAYHYRGKAKFMIGQHFAAISDFEKAIELKPDYAEAYHHRGLVKYSFKQYFAAIRDYNTAIELKPDYAEAYLTRGVAKYDLGQSFAAIKDFDIAITLEPDEAWAYYLRAGVKYDLGYTLEAKQDLKTALRLARQVGDESLNAQIEEAIRNFD